ncbi:unnamed protein product [Tetraodon nigroviridis]|uniref:Chromosome 15 SCAF14981, whole genome shotgun sequence n=1 Tax=Tetraodon nigroviridis TaxID=99883 RepID=Q4RWU2_TETNG|nr:unnamed protein product [Tetraodon nigroviridis]
MPSRTQWCEGRNCCILLSLLPAWLSFSPFHTGLFCIGPKLRPLRYRFPGGRFNSITVCCMLRWAVTLDVLTFKIPSNCK